MIDTTSIAAAGADIRSLSHETVVRAGAAEVWAAWTTSEAMASWWNPPKTTIDLRVGGPFELLFDLEQSEGSRGSEGCQFLGYVPGEMLSFTWNAPPHLRLRLTHTWVVITFTELDEESTRVRLVHTGFLEGPDWDDYVRYFNGAWEHVLGLLAEHWAV